MKIHLIKKKTIEEFVLANARSKSSFSIWLLNLKYAEWNKPGDIMATFDSADLLGNGCSPSADVPDVDLQTLVDGFNNGAVLNQFKTNLTTLIANQTGYTQVSAAINSLQSSIQNFNTTVTSKLNKMVIKKAVETYVTNLAFSLLSGCSSPVINATIRPTAKSAITPFVEYYQKIQSGILNADGSTPGASDTSLTT